MKSKYVARYRGERELVQGQLYAWVSLQILRARAYKRELRWELPLHVEACQAGRPIACTRERFRHLRRLPSEAKSHGSGAAEVEMLIDSRVPPQGSGGRG